MIRQAAVIMKVGISVCPPCKENIIRETAVITVWPPGLEMVIRQVAAIMNVYHCLSFLFV